MDSANEKSRLEQIAADSWYARGANASSVLHSAKIFDRYWSGANCLELGPAEGLMTEILAGRFKDLTVVDGSAEFCKSLQKRFPHARVIQSLFEDFKPDKKFDSIVMGHVLEHVDSPRKLLEQARESLTPEGCIYAAVPNARSLHRQAAVIMGMLDTEHSLNPTDIHHGHRRVYDPESFRVEFLKAGLKIKIFGGYWIKPLSLAQIDAQWTPEMLRAFMELGERYPDIAGEIYVVASR